MILSRVHFKEELVLHHFAKDMSDEDVSLLNPRSAGGGNNEGNICHFRYDSPIVSSKGHCFYSHLFSDLKGFEDIGGVSAGTDANGDIPLFAEGPELFGEDFVKGEVIGDAGENRSICGKGNCGEGRTVYDISIDEFRREVLSIGSASPISEEEKFVSCFEGMGNKLDRLKEYGEVLFKETCFNIRTFLKSLPYNIFH